MTTVLVFAIVRHGCHAMECHAMDRGVDVSTTLLNFSFSSCLFVYLNTIIITFREFTLSSTAFAPPRSSPPHPRYRSMGGSFLYKFSKCRPPLGLIVLPLLFPVLSHDMTGLPNVVYFVRIWHCAWCLAVCIPCNIVQPWPCFASHFYFRRVPI